MTINVFVSYASSDRPVVEALVHQFQPNMIVWWDRELIAGQTYSKELFAKIARADLTLVAWSTKAARSKWVTNEVKHALRHSIVIPLLLDDTPLPPNLAHIDGIDLRGWDTLTETREVAQLMRDVKLHVGSKRKAATEVLQASPTVRTVSNSSRTADTGSRRAVRVQTSRLGAFNDSIVSLTPVLIVVVIVVAFVTSIIFATLVLAVAILATYRFIPAVDRWKFLLPTLPLLVVFVLISGVHVLDHPELYGDISVSSRSAVERAVITAFTDQDVPFGSQAPPQLIAELTRLSADSKRLCKAVDYGERTARAALEELGYSMSVSSADEISQRALRPLQIYKPAQLQRVPSKPVIVGSLVALEQQRDSRHDRAGAYADARASAPTPLIDRLYEAGCLESEWGTLDASVSPSGPKPRSIAPLVIDVPPEANWGADFHKLLADNRLDQARLLLENASLSDAAAKETLAALYVINSRDPLEEAKGYALMREAARMGSPQAIANLGFFHMFGLGTYIDPGFAAELLDLAFAKGLAPRNATWLLREGSHLMRISDFAEVTMEMKRSATEGSHAARAILGVFAARGLSVPPCGSGCFDIARQYVNELRNVGKIKLAALIESEIHVHDQTGRERALIEMNALVMWPNVVRALAPAAREYAEHRDFQRKAIESSKPIPVDRLERPRPRGHR